MARLRTLRRWLADSPTLTIKQFSAGFALLFLFLTVVLIGEGLLVNANRHRISDQQHSRLVSCRRTYEGIREVFQPFFPPKGHRSKQQQSDLHKFNVTVNRLKSRCAIQIKPRRQP